MTRPGKGSDESHSRAFRVRSGLGNNKVIQLEDDDFSRLREWLACLAFWLSTIPPWTAI